MTSPRKIAVDELGQVDSSLAGTLAAFADDFGNLGHKGSDGISIYAHFSGVSVLALPSFGSDVALNTFQALSNTTTNAILSTNSGSFATQTANAGMNQNIIAMACSNPTNFLSGAMVKILDGKPLYIAVDAATNVVATFIRI